MPKLINVQKKALKKRTTENQSSAYKESLKPDFNFVMGLLGFGSSCITEEGDLNVNDLLCLDYSQFTPSQLEIIKNFQRYVMIDKYGSDEVVKVECVGSDH